MLQRDYFMRMTEMLTTVLMKVVLNKEKKNFEDAQQEIETAAKTIVGLDLKIIKILSPDDVIKLMKTSDVYAGRCIVSAELLREYALISDEKNQINESVNIFKKSLWLYIEAVLTDELPSPQDFYSKINELIKKLNHSELPLNLRARIFEYYEYSGQYSKAEDILFELIDENNKEIYNSGILFYKRLQNKPESELMTGNLSRGEVEDGLNELMSKASNGK